MLHSKLGFSFFSVVFVGAFWALGFSFLPILHFALDDFYQSPAFRFGLHTEYASAFSWTLVLSVIFIGLSLYERRVLQKNPEFFTLKIRLIAFRCLLVIIGMLITYDIISLLHRALNGNQLNSVEFLHVLLTLLTLSTGIFYIILETHFVAVVLSKTYCMSVLGVTIFCVVLGATLTLHFASPATMALAREDVNKYDDIPKVAGAIKDYAVLHKELPPNLEVLTSELNTFTPIPDLFAKITYRPLDKTTFELCTTFSTDSRQAFRIAYHLKKDAYTKGKKCRIYTLTPEGEGFSLSHTESPKLP